MARFFRRRKFCRFTADNVKEIDSFDLQISNYDSLRGIPKYEPPSTTEHGGIFAERGSSGLSSAMCPDTHGPQ